MRWRRRCWLINYDDDSDNDDTNDDGGDDANYTDDDDDIDSDDDDDDDCDDDYVFAITRYYVCEPTYTAASAEVSSDDGSNVLNALVGQLNK